MVATICVQGYCGGLGEPSDDAELAAYESRDGGVTWQEIGKPPIGTSLMVSPGNGELVGWRYDAERDSVQWFTWPGMEPNTPQSGRAWRQLQDGQVVWSQCPDSHPHTGCTLFDEAGNVVAEPVKLPTTGPHSVIRGETIDLVWWIPYPRDSASTVYVSQVSPTGELLRTVKLEGIDPTPIGWIDDNRIVIRRWGLHERGLADAALLDFGTGEVNPIEGLQPTAQDRDSYLTEIVRGTFAMVDAPGSCLHVRAEPGTAAETLGCFADRVLFTVTGEAVSGPEGTEWLPVRAPGAVEGLASTEFLIR
jgi:hypothetical protein